MAKLTWLKTKNPLNIEIVDFMAKLGSTSPAKLPCVLSTSWHHGHPLHHPGGQLKLRILFLALVLITSSVIIRWSALSSVAAKNRISTPATDSTARLDDPRCLSRTQQSLILKSTAKLPQMPVTLEEAWKQYGELHRRCSVSKNWSEAVGEIHGENGDQQVIDGRCKYVVFMDSELVGLGNRFAALASAFAFAVATDRVILVDNRRKLGDLLCEPFLEWSWLLSGNDFPFDQLRNAARISQFARDNRSRIAKVDLWDVPRPDDLLLFCEDTYDSLSKVPWIVWISDLYTIPNLFLVPSFWQRMRTLFPDPEQVFALISRLILLPSNEVWSIVLKEYQTYLSGAQSLVGVQIRLHGRADRIAFDASANGMITECLANHSYIPELAPTIRNASELATIYSNKLRSGWKSGEVDVAILVTSLNGQYVRKMKERYSEGRGTMDGKLVRVHAVSELSNQDFTFRQSELAFAEMKLLSMSEFLATSASSTFGYAAMAWGNVRPLILDFAQPLQNDGSLSCREGISVDPCSHLPQKPPCLQNSVENRRSLTADHRRWIKNHLRLCQDRPQAAWQLVGTSSSPPVNRTNSTSPLSLPILLPPVFAFDDNHDRA